MSGITENKISIITLDDEVQHRFADELAEAIYRKRRNLKEITELVDTANDPRRASGFYGFGNEEQRMHVLATAAIRLESECRTLACAAKAVGVSDSLVHGLWNGASVTRASQIDD